MMRQRAIRSKFYCGLCIFLIIIALEFVFYNQVDHKYQKKRTFHKLSNRRSLSRDSSNQSMSKGVISDARINVIVAYMRTGSTFVAATLQEYPKTFYYYEPTRSLLRQFMDHSEPIVNIVYPNGTKINAVPMEKTSYNLKEITNYMTCNLGDITVTSLLGKEHRRTKKMINLWLCTKEYINNTKENTPLNKIANWTRCLERVKHKCMASNVLLFKFIRIRLSEIKTLLPKFPNMKILYLNRDPRAIFHSRYHLPTAPEIPSFKDVNKHCYEWLEDIQEARGLTEVYPDRFKAVRYEDIAQHPVDQFREISDFFGIEFVPEVRSYLENITSGGKDGGIWEIKRADPYKTSQRWRKEMKFQMASVISQRCEKGMRELNYYSFETKQDMRNLNLPARGNVTKGTNRLKYKKDQLDLVHDVIYRFE